MIQFILGTIIAFVIMMKKVVLPDWVSSDKEDKVFGICLTSVTSIAIGFLLFAIIGMPISYKAKQIPIEESREKLVTFKDNNNISGSFFLGTGSIEGDLYYYYYKEVGDGRYISGKISSYRCVINETDEVSPCIVSYKSEFGNKYWKLFSFPDKHFKSDIYIPKNSIVRGFKLDLQ